MIEKLAGNPAGGFTILMTKSDSNSHSPAGGPVLRPEIKLAVLLPCYNESMSIRAVVTEFRKVLPGADIYVYDNNSSDNTAEEAAAAGAVVRLEPWPGKGNVVRRMFADIDADVYLMADGDGTYDASVAEDMIQKLIGEQLDMLVGTRMNIYDNAHRTGHAMGNRLFNGIYRAFFGPLFNDIFSGYRVFSRRFVKTFPAVSSGFEIETEMSVHASQLRMPVAEMQTHYGARQEGSVSKLRTIHDALRIFRTFVLLFKEIKPLRFYSIFGGVFLLAAFALGIPLVVTYFNTGLVPRLPTAILVTILAMFGAICQTCGLILDSVARGRLEHKRIAYLSFNPVRKT